MDPLASSNINPSWSNSPETPTNALPQPQRRSPSPPAREPKVFGAPGLGLVQPPVQASDASGSGSGSGGRGPIVAPAPFLRVRIGALERNRKDLLIRFDASTNLPNFRTTLYRNMQRSYVEFVRFAEQAQLTSPQTIIPALPLPSTSAVTDEEDDRLVRIAIQRWFTRICEDPVLIKDDELRSFIESDFGYSPVPPPSARRHASSTSAVPGVFSAALSKVVRRGPLDEDDELQSAKVAVEKLEERWGGAAAAVGNLGKARRALAVSNSDVGAKLISLSTVESDMHLAAAERKMGRTWEQLSGMMGAQAASENVTLSDSLGYQALNARSAKDALAQRTQLLEDSQTATKAAINKRRNVERLKGSSSINQAKVDDALSEMQEANALETAISSKVSAISAHLHQALRAHSRHAHEDVAVSLLEAARMSVMYHKHTLRELEALRPDLARVGVAGPLPPPPLSVQSTPTRASASLPSQPPQVPSSAPRGYQAPLPPSTSSARPPPPPTMDTSKSMFLPGQNGHPRPQSVGSLPPQISQHATMNAPNPGMSGGTFDPLGGQTQMTQSMVLPGSNQGQRGGPVGRGPTRRLDERQAAKLLAGGF
nr:uncharacterized protein CI109_002444 [Kwoniella shandongensis]KAA5529103.1 hypothetical protein CI109_002444 [Kwoniella shandongensis]